MSSVIAWRRVAKKAVTIRGMEIPAGAKLLLYNGAANHDESVFANAEAFDIERENAKRHISFGYGAHLCIGAPLARRPAAFYEGESVKPSSSDEADGD